MPEDSISFNMINLASDPLRISIWFEIQRKPGITAKELMTRLKLEGTNIYYHLKKLEEGKLIVAETKPVPKSNLLEKFYSVNMEFFAPEEWKARRKIGESRKYLKEIYLYTLYFNMFLINKLIIDVQEKSEEEILKLIEDEKHPMSKVIFFKKEDLPPVRDKIAELYELTMQVKRDAGRDPTKDISDATDALLLSLLPL